MIKLGIRERIILGFILGSGFFFIAGIIIFIGGQRISSIAVNYGELIEVKMLMNEISRGIDQAVKFSAPDVLGNIIPVFEEISQRVEKIKRLGVDTKDIEGKVKSFNDMVQKMSKVSEFSPEDVANLADSSNILSGSFINLQTNYSERIKDIVRIQNITIILSVIFSIIFISTIGMLYGIQVHKNLLGVSRRLKEVAEGATDLRKFLSYSGKDEIGELCGNFNQFLKKLIEIIKYFSEIAQRVDEFSDETYKLIDDFSEKISEQILELSRISTASEEFSSTISESTKNLSHVSGITEESYQIFSDRTKIINSSLETIVDFTSRLKNITSDISRVEEMRKKIEGFVSAITDITDQTNLLALNASIEAARAGEHGKGFAVVADEVRRLAGRTFQLAKEISSNISQFGNTVAKTTENIIKVTQKVEENTKIVSDGIKSLSKIQEKFSKTKDQVSSISAAFTQQERAGAEIARSITRVSAILDDSRKSLEDLKNKLKGLREYAKRLSELISNFKF